MRQKDIYEKSFLCRSDLENIVVIHTYFYYYFLKIESRTTELISVSLVYTINFSQKGGGDVKNLKEVFYNIFFFFQEIKEL